MLLCRSGTTDTTFIETRANIAAADNQIGAHALFNLSALCDGAPPATPNTAIQSQINESNYEMIGRYFRVGLRFRIQSSGSTLPFPPPQG